MRVRLRRPCMEAIDNARRQKCVKFPGPMSLRIFLKNLLPKLGKRPMVTTGISLARSLIAGFVTFNQGFPLPFVYPHSLLFLLRLQFQSQMVGLFVKKGQDRIDGRVRSRVKESGWHSSRARHTLTARPT